MRNQFTDSVPIKVQKRSGFDKSHFHLLSAKVGTLVPILVDELIPNSTVNLRQAVSVSMPPLASDTYMNVDLKVEAFFCPLRVLYKGFEGWFADKSMPFINGSTGNIAETKHYMPVVRLTDLVDTSGDVPKYSDFAHQVLGANSLLDYLGFGVPGDDFWGNFDNPLNVPSFDINPLPLLAYHMIYDKWYRNTMIQKPLFVPYEGGSILGSGFWPAALPFFALGPTQYIFSVDSLADCRLADGVSLFRTRQRNFGFDYFTNAWPSAQFGSEAKVTIDANDQFSISQLRSMNSIQQFRERNNLASEKLVDVVKARYGADLSSGVAQMPLFLGSATYNVYSKSVDVTANSQAQSTSPRTNPFSYAAGAQLGRAYALGSDFLVDHFTANEPGYLMVLASLVPKATYPLGVSRLLTRYVGGAGSLADMANPLLQNVGNQPIYSREVIPFFTDFDYVFGYTDRYADFMTMNNRISGLFRKYGLEGFDFQHNEVASPSRLDFMALQRYYLTVENDETSFISPSISSQWLSIPVDYFDGIAAAANWLSQYGYWLQCSFDYKVVQPLAEFSIPSLQDPAYEHGETVIVHRGGFKL